MLTILFHFDVKPFSMITNHLFGQQQWDLISLLKLNKTFTTLFVRRFQVTNRTFSSRYFFDTVYFIFIVLSCLVLIEMIPLHIVILGVLAALSDHGVYSEQRFDLWLSQIFFQLSKLLRFFRYDLWKISQNMLWMTNGLHRTTTILHSSLPRS